MILSAYLDAFPSLLSLFDDHLLFPLLQQRLRKNLKPPRKWNPQSPLLGSSVLGSHLKELVLQNGKLNYTRLEEPGKSRLPLTRVIQSLKELILVSLRKHYLHLSMTTTSACSTINYSIVP